MFNSYVLVGIFKIIKGFFLIFVIFGVGKYVLLVIIVGDFVIFYIGVDFFRVVSILFDLIFVVVYSVDSVFLLMEFFGIFLVLVFESKLLCCFWCYR